MPDLEAEERPESQLFVATAAHVIPEHRLDRRPLEVRAHERILAEQQIVRVVLEPATEPLVERDPETGAPSPYILIRRTLEALIDRKSYYRLVDVGAVEEVDGVEMFGVWSSGQFFPFIPAAELEF